VEKIIEKVIILMIYKMRIEYKGIIVIFHKIKVKNLPNPVEIWWDNSEPLDEYTLSSGHAIEQNSSLKEGIETLKGMQKIIDKYDKRFNYEKRRC